MCKVKLGYEFTYLYCAVNPGSGHLIGLLLPDMTKVCFEIFLKYFNQQVNKMYGNRKVLMILDQASSHHPPLHGNPDIVLQYLPVASPQLNCVERLFEEIRKPLSNQVFPSIKKVEIKLAEILKQYYKHPKHLIKLCYFPYMRHS